MGGSPICIFSSANPKRRWSPPRLPTRSFSGAAGRGRQELRAAGGALECLWIFCALRRRPQFEEFALRPARVSGYGDPAQYRYRLLALSQPAEDLSIFKSSGTQWFTDPLAQSPPQVRVLAENVIALVVLPKETDSVETNIPAAQRIGAGYAYDSRTAWSGTTQPATMNQLCPVIRLAMVVIDESSARRLQGASPTPLNLGFSYDGLILRSRQDGRRPADHRQRLSVPAHRLSHFPNRNSPAQRPVDRPVTVRRRAALSSPLVRMKSPRPLPFLAAWPSWSCWSASLLVSVLIVSFLSSVTTELKSSKSYAEHDDGAAARGFRAQYRHRTDQGRHGGPPRRPASFWPGRPQPGMIRTFDTAGQPAGYFKLLFLRHDVRIRRLSVARRYRLRGTRPPPSIPTSTSPCSACWPIMNAAAEGKVEGFAIDETDAAVSGKKNPRPCPCSGSMFCRMAG